MKFLEGKALAENLKEEIKKDAKGLRLAIVIVGENEVSNAFVWLKEKYAMDVGIKTERYQYPADISEQEFKEELKKVSSDSKNDGVIVQLPLPPDFDTKSLLNLIPKEKDVDVLSDPAVSEFDKGNLSIKPPVLAGIETLFNEHRIPVRSKNVVVVGHGMLVGKPVASWLKQEGAQVTIMADPDSFDPSSLGIADIIISGAGKPGIIRGGDIKEGVVIVDVGTSEEAGKLVGDVDRESLDDKPSFITPEKGGVGPLTVAFVFKNLTTLAKK